MLLGLFLSALATLNFSLSLIIGVLASPFSFLRPIRSRSRSGYLINAAQVLLLTALSPPVVVTIATTVASQYFGFAGVDLGQVLGMAMQGWWVHGLWTSLVVWLVWWPAWFAVSFVVGVGIFSEKEV
jgi:glycosylphosphatidylinositol transamidase